MQTDPRPAVAIGHVHLSVKDVAAEYEFFLNHGMREILQRENFAILELRGGTHLILDQSEYAIVSGTRTGFDLMVDDIDEADQGFVTVGCETTAIERGNIHDSFTVTSPNGYQVPVNSSHAAGPV